MRSLNTRGRNLRADPALSFFSDLVFEAGVVARSLGDFFAGGGLRLGVTGLSRSGKTVFLTALVNNLIAGVRLPVLARLRRGAHRPRASRAAARRRGAALPLRGSSCEPLRTRSPLAAVDPAHLAAAADDRVRERQPLERRQRAASTSTSSTTPANGCSTCRCSTSPTAIGRARRSPPRGRRPRAPLAADWNGFVAGLDPHAQADEDEGGDSAELFTAYLRQARESVYALSTLPPGPLPVAGRSRRLAGADLRAAAARRGDEIAAGSLAAMMERRYEAYKTHVARPFFRDHFARLDRQIVLVDLLTALNSGPAALRDLETALDGVMRRLPRRPRLAARGDLPAAHRPHPVRRHQGRPSAPRRPRPARGGR